MRTYNHTAIESKWQKLWGEERLYETPDTVPDKENFYLLTEFSYPSGTLHVGHWYAFAVPDILARKRRMEGYNVLYPVGFDALGLPAENAAIKRGVDPRAWTYENIAHMREQLRSMGNSFDWSREVVTADPEYYRWTQWLFLKFFNAGLAERKKAPVNWCPGCQTVLANEQVVKKESRIKNQESRQEKSEIISVCERCDTVVIQRELEQWFLKITKYADRLLDDLATLDWPEEIKEAQRNWIGRSEGALITFKVKSEKGKTTIQKEIEIFTTRPDTLFGATYIVLSPEHRFVEELEAQIENGDEFRRYRKQAAGKTEVQRQAETKEKTGMELKGIKAVNPANGEEIPIWAADYVLARYGTGAVMGVPAHDERDFEFAKKYSLPIRQVIAPETGNKREHEEYRDGGCGVVFDPKMQKYAVAHWRQTGLYGLFSGGVDDGEEMQTGVLREVEEESGLHDFDHVEETAVSFAHYYHIAKKLNRFAKATCYLVVIKSSATKGQKLEEHEQFDVKWVSAEEVLANWRERNDDRGLDHWASFLKCSVGRAIELGYDTTSDPRIFYPSAYTGEGVLVHSGKFDGVSTSEARRVITEHVGGTMTATYHLRDWLVSRQRYWGCPIPIVYDPEGKVHPVPEKNLPWLLPDDVIDFTPKGTSPLGTSQELIARTEHIFGKGWRPEIDTLDTFVDSSWYFVRYLDSRNDEEFSSREKQALWMPVDRYSGGAEHTTMHLLYSRFFYKAMDDLGLLASREARGGSDPPRPRRIRPSSAASSAVASEPFRTRMNRGIVLGTDGRKMSKRWGNVIDPDAEVARVGADAVRMYLAFIGPYNEAGHYPWQTGGLVGMRRFLEKVWKLKSKISEQNLQSSAKNSRLESALHQTVKKVGDDIEAFKFNTAISALMVFVNALEKEEEIAREYYETLLRLLAAFAPHLTEELWHEQGNQGSIHRERWPLYDERLFGSTKKIVLQIDGVVRALVECPEGLDEAAVLARARALPTVGKYLMGKTLLRTVYVPDRLLNIVLK